MTDRHHVELPALDGLDPLGFLAALGVLHLLAHRGVDARLSFDPTLATARLTGVESIDEVVDHLVALVEGLPPDGLMVGLPPEIVPSAAIGAEFSDPARIGPEQFAEYVDQSADQHARAWIRALWTDLAISDEGRCATTPFYAPTGRQTLRTAFEKPATLVATQPGSILREALASWRRLDGFTGENIDFRAVRGAADQPDGRATMSGVPGATWLALSSIPLFPMGGDGVHARTRRWQRLRFAVQDRLRFAFSWPIWRVPLDLHAVTALLGHPVIDVAATMAAGSGGGRLSTTTISEQRARDQLRVLGVERVVVAHRRQLPGGKAAGVLVPAGSWS